MRLGLGELRLSPEQFWKMTLRELVAAFGPQQASLQRREMDELMKAWPD
jgi:uncharacterized phage protein (TIGR02216 family)